MRGTHGSWPAIVMSALSSAGAAQSAGGDGARFAHSPQYPLLPRELEIELALSAAPKHLRGEAKVWTLDKTGYSVAKKGTNAFSCIVSRRAGDLFPVCWDAEGARSLLPLDFADAQMRLAGQSGTEIDAVVAQRFRPGIIIRPHERESRTCCRRCGTESTSTASCRAPCRIRT